MEMGETSGSKKKSNNISKIIERDGFAVPIILSEDLTSKVQKLT